MKSRGFSLIEVVAAMALVGIALIAVLNMFTLGNRDVITRREELIALSLVRGKLEELKAKDLANVVNEAGIICSGLNSCQMNVTVTSNFGSPTWTGKKQVYVQVLWTGADNVMRQEGASIVIGDVWGGP